MEHSSLPDDSVTPDEIERIQRIAACAKSLSTEKKLSLFLRTAELGDVNQAQLLREGTIESQSCGSLAFAEQEQAGLVESFDGKDVPGYTRRERVFTVNPQGIEQFEADLQALLHQNPPKQE